MQRVAAAVTVMTSVVTTVVLLACGGSAPPAASNTPTSPSPTPAPSPAPTPPATFAIVLPVADGDTASDAFGLNPFGIHFGGTGPGGHGFDGHPGWDVEYRIGASVRAAADGSVQSVFEDSHTAGRFTIQLHHQTSSGAAYRTVYTNVTSPAAGVAAGAPVTRGQPLGAAGSQTQVIGSRQRTWAMTHFQVDDFSQNEGSTNPNAVNPERFLASVGRQMFEAVWRMAAWDVELTEPFTGNPRDVAFPLRRTWSHQSGGQLPVRLDFIRADPASGTHTYELYNMTGALVERGSVVFTPSAGMSQIDLRAEQGAIRLGVVDIVGDEMRISAAAPGMPRPHSLDDALTYRTTR